MYFFNDETIEENIPEDEQENEEELKSDEDDLKELDFSS